MPNLPKSKNITALFNRLKARGIIALPNIGPNATDGRPSMASRTNHKAQGYAFYARNDISDDKRHVYLSYGTFKRSTIQGKNPIRGKPIPSQAIRIGNEIVKALQFLNIPYQWNGSLYSKIRVKL